MGGTVELGEEDVGGSRSMHTIGFCGRCEPNRMEVHAEVRTWSDVVYDGMEVYRIFVILDLSGVSGESVWVAYSTLSVHDGVRFVLES